MSQPQALFVLLFTLNEVSTLLHILLRYVKIAFLRRPRIRSACTRNNCRCGMHFCFLLKRSQLLSCALRYFVTQQKKIKYIRVQYKVCCWVCTYCACGQRHCTTKTMFTEQVSSYCWHYLGILTVFPSAQYVRFVKGALQHFSNMVKKCCQLAAEAPLNIWAKRYSAVRGM